MGHAPSDRAAADGENEQVCTRLVVPARDCHGFLRKPRNDKWESDIRVIARAQRARGNPFPFDWLRHSSVIFSPLASRSRSACDRRR